MTKRLTLEEMTDALDNRFKGNRVYRQRAIDVYKSFLAGAALMQGNNDGMRKQGFLTMRQARTDALDLLNKYPLSPVMREFHSIIKGDARLAHDSARQRAIDLGFKARRSVASLLFDQHP